MYSTDTIPLAKIVRQENIWDCGVLLIKVMESWYGVPGPGWQTEKFTVVDNEKRVKVAEVIESGYLELGFTLFRVRAEIIECPSSSCIIKSSLEYELKEEAAANVAIDSLVSAHPFAKIAEIAKNHLLLQNENNRDYDA
ncbi:hypothetical protein ACLB2K_075453 [Fragaria x ananassa]